MFLLSFRLASTPQPEQLLAEDEIVAMDAGVKISDLQEAGIERYVLRLATNFTARSNYLPDHSGKGRKPVYGQRIRPLERHYKDKTMAKSSPDRVETWSEAGSHMRAEIWEGVVLPDVTPDPQAKTFNVYAIYDPAYTPPWLLATPLKLKASTVKANYQDLWPVEQIPLSAKQMVGAHRQFVHADESIQRLPELALLVGSILVFLAATARLCLPVSGIANRNARLAAFAARLWANHFRKVTLCQSNFVKKASITTHLPKGFLARRPKTEVLALVSGY